MHNNRGNGYSRYDSQPSSSRSYDRWHDDSEWSARNETWRGSRSPRRLERSPASDHRHRNDSWKDEHSYRDRDDFRLGRDRAPMPIDDHFLARHGAKRLQNGNLVDRDGYTLRTRDPHCRAPSPPNYNPGREARLADIRSGNVRRNELNRMSEADLNRKARQQMELAREQLSSDRSTERLESTEAERRREREKRQENGTKKNQNQNHQKTSSEIGAETEQEEDVEGEDEYEEDDDGPVEKKKTSVTTGDNENGLSTYANNIKKALLMAPPFVKKTLLPGGPLQQAPKLAGSPNDTTQKSWFRQYQEHVDALKEKVYGHPPATTATTSITSKSNYFFQAPPTCGPFGGPAPSQDSSSSPYYSGAAPGASGAPTTSSGAPGTYATPFGEIYSNPTPSPPSTVIPPLQMPLPPPGVVGFVGRDSGAPGTNFEDSRRFGADFGAPGAPGTNSRDFGASGADFGASRPHGGAWTTFEGSGATSAYSGAFSRDTDARGANFGAPASNSAYSRHFGAVKPESSDSEEEDEAILKLREIIRTCGSASRR